LGEKFDFIVKKGIDENQLSSNLQKQGKYGANSQTKARDLLNKLVQHKKKIMWFLTDL
jgi:hypothetical protein